MSVLDDRAGAMSGPGDRAATVSARSDPDVLVVGGGPAGLAAARAAAGAGAQVLLVERDVRLGGILNQCVHDGFGLELFGESLTGPEYAARLVSELGPGQVDVSLESIVLSIDADRTCRVLSPRGYETVRPGAVILAMGCRERSFGALAVPGQRPAGIYSAGTAQRLINIDGLAVGRRAVILGSGDIGLIMARRLVFEGAEVACVVEKLPYPGGLARNVSQCLNDFGIPLLLRHTVVEVLGRGRLTGVRIAEVDDQGTAVAGTDRIVECDTLLVSVGLIPENELTRVAGAEMDPSSGGAMVDQRLTTTIPGVFACGNVLHVHDLADWASLEGRRAGQWAAEFASRPWSAMSAPGQAPAAGPGGPAGSIAVRKPDDLRYVVPQRLGPERAATLSFRVKEPRRKVTVAAARGGAEVASRRFSYLAPSELATLEVPALPPGGQPLEVTLD